MTCVLAIDIGGTKLAAALVDEAGSILRSATRPTPPADVMSVLAALIAEVLDGGPPPQAVGIGCAGPLDLATGTVSPVNMPSWRKFPLRDEVRKLTGLPTMLAGDAQCFALGEHWLGAGRGCSSLLGIVVSTGIGGGLVIDGAPLLGPTGNAGHVGHMSIDPYGERCECGGRGCVERYASGPNMVRWALENGWSPATAAEPRQAPALHASEPTVPGAQQSHLSGDGRAYDGSPAGVGVAGRNGGAGRDGTVERDGVVEHGGTAERDAAAEGDRTTHLDGATEHDGAFDRGSAAERDGTVGRGRTAEGDGAAVRRDEVAERDGVVGRDGAVERTEVKVDARALARDAAEGHPVAVAAFERGARALAGMIASTAAAAEVTTVVIGGGVSAAGDILFDPLRRAFDDVAGLDFVRVVQVKQSTLGVRAGLAGAANLAWQAIRPPS